MQYTTHYNLITVEGTDVVNPLVQMNPNFTDIDAAMFANKQAVIGSASEIVSGTVHAITRANSDSNYFRYTATGNWTAGDTMSVDGVNVSVYLTDGTTPATGAYVINSEVFGMISGSRVTLFLASSPVTSLNADQVTFNPSGTGLDPSDTDVDKAIRDIDSIINKGSVSVTADGVDTYSQVLGDLYALIDASKINTKSTLRVGNIIYHISAINPTSYVFTTQGSTSSMIRFYLAALSTTSVFRNADVATDSTIYRDLSATVPTVGTVFSIDY